MCSGNTGRMRDCCLKNMENPDILIRDDDDGHPAGTLADCTFFLYI